MNRAVILHQTCHHSLWENMKKNIFITKLVMVTGLSGVQLGL